MEKIDTALKARMAETKDATERISVLVRLREGATAASAAPPGLEVTNRFDSIGTIAGRVRKADIDRLSRAADVEAVEFDGEMHTQK